MKKYLSQFGHDESWFISFSFYLSLFYIIIRFIDVFFIFTPWLGDEHAFAEDLAMYMGKGFGAAVIDGISVPFTLFVYVLNNLLNDISLSLRVTGTLFTLITVIYIYYRTNIDKKNIKVFFLFIFFLIGTSGGTFYGTNDSFFFLGVIIFVNEASLLITDSRAYNQLLLFIGAIIIITTRLHFIIWIPIFFFSWIIYGLTSVFEFNKNKILIIFLSIVLGLVTTTILSYPRIKNGDYRFSYENKIYHKHPDANWVQWHYYSQHIANKNGLGFFSKMVDYNEVREYLKNNDDDSLPKSIMEWMSYNPRDILLNGIRSIIEIIIFSVRYVGLMLLFVPYIIYQKYKNNNFGQHLFLLVFILVGITVFAIIWPHLVQHRWLYPIYIFQLIIFFSDRSIISQKIYPYFLFGNLFLIDLIIVWALWKENLFYNI